MNKYSYFAFCKWHYFTFHLMQLFNSFCIKCKHWAWNGFFIGLFFLLRNTFVNFLFTFFFNYSLKAKLYNLTIQSRTMWKVLCVLFFGFVLNRIKKKKQNEVKWKTEKRIEGSVVYPLLSAGAFFVRSYFNKMYVPARVCVCVFVCILRHGK